MEIKRDHYLKKLIDRMHNGLIKVVTGLRRCGKSYLVFTLFKNYLLSSGVRADHIITMAFDVRENMRYRDPDVLLAYIKESVRDDGNYYILLDEIQMLTDFESVLNSLLHIPNVDVYVTGSNSRFLTSDIVTEFRGRGDEVRLYPLTFYEYMTAFEGDRYQGLQEYYLYGGLPLIVTMKSDEQKSRYLKNLFAETYIKDLIEHNKIAKTEELDELIDIMASDIGAYTNPAKITNTFHSVLNSKITEPTVQRYIEYLTDAYLISEAKRYDVKGRKYIGNPRKYYFEDMGLRNARLNFRQTEETHIMENVIYNELRARDFNVDVGTVKTRKTKDGVTRRNKLEIDFVASSGSKKYYIQSAFSLYPAEKEQQEKASLMNAMDGFTKIIITGDVRKPQRDKNGILVMSIYDFLLDQNSLEK
ncbi:MAG: ATP-binding protein [Eubacterium sp.]